MIQTNKELTKMDKTIKILTVINGEDSEPIWYTAKCTDDIVLDVKNAINELDLEINESEIEDIASEMLHNRAYWFDEKWCFQRIFV